MAYNKIVLGEDNVLLDISEDTVSEEDVKVGKTFHKANGTPSTGTWVPSSEYVLTPDSYEEGNFATYDRATGKMVDSGYSPEDIRKNSEAIEILSEGISEDKIDGVKDLLKYVEEHGTDVQKMKDDIKENRKDIDECKANRHNIENGKSRRSIQLKDGNADAYSSVDLSENGIYSLPYESEEIEYIFDNDESEEWKRKNFAVGRITLNSASMFYTDNFTGEPDIVFGDGSYIKCEFSPVIYYDSYGNALLYPDDNPESTSPATIEVDTYIHKINNNRLYSEFYDDDGVIKQYRKLIDGRNGLITVKNKGKSGALGVASSTFGLGTVAINDYETVVGKYNAIIDGSLFTVGVGNSDNTRANAFNVFESGEIGILKPISTVSSEGNVLSLGSDNRIKITRFSSGSSIANTIMARDNNKRCFVNTPQLTRGGDYQVVNRMYSDNHSGGSTSIPVYAGTPKKFKFSCTDQNVNYPHSARGEYKGIGMYVFYGNACTITVTKSDGTALGSFSGKFMIVSVSPGDNDNNAIRICAMYYNSLLDAGWKHVYATLGDTLTFTSGQDTSFVYYHQASGFRVPFPS